MKRFKSAKVLAIGAIAAAAILVALGADHAGAADKVNKEKTSPGYMGVRMQTLTSDVKKGLDLEVDKGVLVSGIEADSPAEKAGLEEGDVIVSFDGKAVESPQDLRRAVRDARPGSTARLEIVREGKSRTLDIEIGERPDDMDFSLEIDPDVDFPGMRHAFAFIGGPRLGINAQEIDNEDMAGYFKVKPGEGVLVLGVEENSVAGKAGVKPGDVVQRIDDSAVVSVDDIRESCRNLDDGDEFTIGVLRHGKPQQLKATMDDSGTTWAFDGNHPGRMHGWKHDAPRAFRVPSYDQDELRRELQELKRELREMKEKLEDRDG